MGHAITGGDTLRLKESFIFEGVKAYECSGTPADCVKMARHFVLKNNRQPDVVVSGINHGSNTSISVLYSGTMSAAIEGAIEGTPSIGFSLCDYGQKADFSHTHEFVRKRHHLVSLWDGEGAPGTEVVLDINKKQNSHVFSLFLCVVKAVSDRHPSADSEGVWSNPNTGCRLSSLPLGAIDPLKSSTNKSLVPGIGETVQSL
jgi:5'-nucleotidase